MTSEKENKFYISAEILKSANIDLEQLRQIGNDLKLLLKDKFGSIIPNQINDLGTLQWLIEIHRNLQKLKSCNGFDRHIQTYNKKQKQSSYFVTVIASYLLDKNVGDIVLEPPILGKENKSDILLIYKNQNVYFECKHTQSFNPNYSLEHEHMLSILRNYIVVPHQISITYKKSMSDDEIRRLGEDIKKRVVSVTGNGKIIDREDIEVQVIKRETYTDMRFQTNLFMMCKVIDNNCNYPGNVYGIDGLTISLSGPKVDSTNLLRAKLKKSKRQSPISEPYVLVIDGSLMLGELTEKARSLSTAFQPKINTRFSAAMIVNHYSKLSKAGNSLEFSYVSNPFAKFPLTSDFEFLFRK
jgi:hypothetical protein